MLRSQSGSFSSVTMNAASSGDSSRSTRRVVRVISRPLTAPRDVARCDGRVPVSRRRAPVARLAGRSRRRGRLLRLLGLLRFLALLVAVTHADLLSSRSVRPAAGRIVEVDGDTLDHPVVETDRMPAGPEITAT